VLHPRDKERLLAVVEAGFGTLEAFTAAVRALAEEGAIHLQASRDAVDETAEDPMCNMVWKCKRRPSTTESIRPSTITTVDGAVDPRYADEAEVTSCAKDMELAENWRCICVWEV